MSANIDLLKNEMREAKVLKTLAPSVLEKKFANSSRHDEKQRKNDLLLFMYSPSKTMPAKIGSLVINYKLYESFMKKIKGFQTKTMLGKNCLKVEYWKLGNRSKGVLELQDISYYFESFKHIPNAEIELDVQEA